MTIATPVSTVGPPSGQLDGLRFRLTGSLLTADSPGYDEARRTLYFLMDRRPLAIVRAANAEDVTAAVRFRGLGGAMARVAPAATAFAHRTQRYFLAIIGIWLDPAEDAAVNTHWTELLWRAIRHEGDGVYVNFLEHEGPERVHDAYPPATYARLAAIKQRYDPENLFRFNQNILPRS